MSLSDLRPWLDGRGATRVLVITGESRRFYDRLEPLLEGLAVEVFDGARVHVPREVVDAAEAVAAGFEPDVAVALGGGAAIGLAKALALEIDLPYAAIPTTYAGSEMTDIYGVRSGDTKNTGRDERVRPRLIARDVELTRSMPRRLTVTSLMNALAHAVSALSAGELSAPGDAIDAAVDLFDALRTLVAKPGHRGARETAQTAAARAAEILDAGHLGEHHRLAHHFGGRLGADHSSLHACLLPHSLAALLRARPDVAETLRQRTGDADLAGTLFSHLVRVGAPTSLLTLGDGAAAAAAELGDLEVATGALLGRDPTARFARLDLGLEHPAAAWGDLESAARIVVAVHGRGATAESIADQARVVIADDPETAIVAPQAPLSRWYPASYRTALEDCPAEVAAALDAVSRAVDAAAARVGRERVFLFGFSQGACLALEWLARAAAPIAGLVALSGARPGPAAAAPAWSAAAREVPAVLGVAAGDPWLDLADVERDAAALGVELLRAPGAEHDIRPLERIAARRLILGPPAAAPAGFGNAHHAEALPGALPVDQNSPRRPPHGLVAEQINGTGFVAPRHRNLRTWFYRVRPSAQHTPFAPIDHPTLASDFSGPQDPNLAGWRAPAIPDAPTDFIDGLITVGGAGSAESRRGFAVHLYAANRGMDARAHYNADSSLLIIPETGNLVLQTDLGVLALGPGEVAVMPRGFRFSVHLPDGAARGYVAEVFGRHFELPERGPVGANGLADPRHFTAPSIWHEDRRHPGYRITAQYAGRLFEATQDFSPYDVAAWHGSYAPHVYDLRRFSPVGNTRIDHGDPSIYTVLSTPLDEPGSHLLDFVFFPPRWDPTEHTFRPPYFHRNATTEINGIISDPSLGAGSPFETGGLFLTPNMTPHGVVARSIERTLAIPDEAADRPRRVGDRSMWFQLESALPMRLSAWGRANRRDDWTDVWGVY